jgi:hypothetical protein
MNGREPPMVEMPPRYSFRLADLRTWHLVEGIDQNRGTDCDH